MIETLDTDLMALMFRKMATKLYMGLTVSESHSLIHNLSVLSTLTTGLSPCEDNTMLAELLENQATHAVNRHMAELINVLMQDG
jgi:hypothetical protein